MSFIIHFRNKFYKYVRLGRRDGVLCTSTTSMLGWGVHKMMPNEEDLICTFYWMPYFACMSCIIYFWNVFGWDSWCIMHVYVSLARPGGWDG